LWISRSRYFSTCGHSNMMASPSAAVNPQQRGREGRRVRTAAARYRGHDGCGKQGCVRTALHQADENYQRAGHLEAAAAAPVGASSAEAARQPRVVRDCAAARKERNRWRVARHLRNVVNMSKPPIITKGNHAHSEVILQSSRIQRPTNRKKPPRIRSTSDKHTTVCRERTETMEKGEREGERESTARNSTSVARTRMRAGGGHSRSSGFVQSGSTTTWPWQQRVAHTRARRP
jgi:hypothetical protein